MKLFDKYLVDLLIILAINCFQLDIMEPKTPEEVYKTWLEGLVLRPTYNLDVPMDSARHNLASTFVNAFVNAGFSRDKLVCVEDGKNWIYKNKQHGL